MLNEILSVVKWLFWLGAAAVLGLGLLLTLIGKGVSGFSDALFILLYCGVIAFPGILIHIVQRQMAE